MPAEATGTVLGTQIIEFVGDSTKLDRTFENVEQGAKDAGKAVENAIGKGAETAARKATKPVADLASVISNVELRGKAAQKSVERLADAMVEGGRVGSGQVRSLIVQQEAYKRAIEATYGSVSRATPEIVANYRKIERSVELAKAEVRELNDAYDDQKGQLAEAGVQWRGLGDGIGIAAGKYGKYVAGAAVGSLVLREVIGLVKTIATFSDTGEVENYYAKWFTAYVEGVRNAKKETLDFIVAQAQMMGAQIRGDYGAVDNIRKGQSTGLLDPIQRAHGIKPGQSHAVVFAGPAKPNGGQILAAQAITTNRLREEAAEAAERAAEKAEKAAAQRLAAMNQRAAAEVAELNAGMVNLRDTAGKTSSARSEAALLEESFARGAFRDRNAASPLAVFPVYQASAKDIMRAVALDYESHMSTIGEMSARVAAGIEASLGDALLAGISGDLEGLQDAFKNFFKGILRELTNMMAQRAVMKFLGMFGGGATLTTSGNLSSIIGQGAGVIGSANGNVLRGGFRAFANGGIVTNPTLGLVGEGKYNEAVVPLPDGRSIPVSMNERPIENVITISMTPGFWAAGAAAMRPLVQPTSREVGILLGDDFAHNGVSRHVIRNR